MTGAGSWRRGMVGRAPFAVFGARVGAKALGRIATCFWSAYGPIPTSLAGAPGGLSGAGFG